MRLLLFGICLLFTYETVAQKPYVYRSSDKLVSVESFAYYFIDSTKNKTFEMLRNDESVFRLNNEGFLNFGNIEYPVWIRLDIQNESEEDLYLLQELHDVRMLDVYALDMGNGLKKWFTGAMRPFGTHLLKRNNTVFDLGKHPKRVYMRVYNPNVYVPLKVGSIRAVANYFHRYDLLYGGIYGVFFALILYNFLLYLIVRDRMFIYYFFYILSSGYIVLRADNHHQEFIFGQIPNFSFDINLSSTITIFFTLLFANNYLKIRELAPRFFWLLAVLWGIGFVLLPFEWLPYNAAINSVYQLLYMIVMLVLLAASVYIHWLGYKPARFFILAFGFYFVGVIGILAGFMGLLPMNNLLTTYIYQICSVLEALFFALAVAYRFNTYRQEARDAKELALRRLQEQEELLVRNNQLLAEKMQIEQQARQYDNDKEINGLLRQMQAGNQLIKKISIPTIEGVIMFPVQDINRLEAMGSYCTIYLTDNKKITTSKPMAYFEQMIDERFMRIHKSHIVNLNNVERYVRGEGGWVRMNDGTEVPVSRRLKAELLRRLSIEQTAV